MTRQTPDRKPPDRQTASSEQDPRASDKRQEREPGSWLQRLGKLIQLSPRGPQGQ